MMLIQHSVNSDWLFNTQSRVLQADWFILEINKKATLNINMPYYMYIIIQYYYLIDIIYFCNRISTRREVLLTLYLALPLSVTMLI